MTSRRTGTTGGWCVNAGPLPSPGASSVAATLQNADAAVLLQVRLTHPVGGAPAGALVLKNAIPSAPGQASSVSATSIGSIEAAAVGDALREGGSDGGGAPPLNIVVKSEVVDEIGGARKRRADEATICESGDNAESSKRLKADEPQELDAVTVPLT